MEIYYNKVSLHPYNQRSAFIYKCLLDIATKKGNKCPFIIRGVGENASQLNTEVDKWDFCSFILPQCVHGGIIQMHATSSCHGCNKHDQLGTLEDKRPLTSGLSSL